MEKEMKTVKVVKARLKVLTITSLKQYIKKLKLWGKKQDNYFLNKVIILALYNK